MTNLLISVLFYSSLMGGNQTKISNIKLENGIFIIDECTKSSTYTTPPMDYYCEKTGQHFTISQTGTCTITAATCQLAQKMAMDCAVATAKAGLDAYIAQLDEGCKDEDDPVD